MFDTQSFFDTVAVSAVAVLVILGVFFNLVTAIGMVRLPDVYTRMQASTKAGTMGVGCIIIAGTIHFHSLAVAAHSVLVIAFIFLTAPVSGHLIGRAAYFVGAPIWGRTKHDELKGCYDPVTHALSAEPEEENEIYADVARQRAELVAGGSIED